MELCVCCAECIEPHTYGDKTVLGKTHVTCVEEVEFTDLVRCYLLCREGFGLDSGLLRGASLGEGKIGAKLGPLVQQ